MNMHQPIQADPSPTAARLHAAWKARRAKEAAAARKVASANQNAPAVKLVAVERQPEPVDKTLFRRPKAQPPVKVLEPPRQADAHVRAFRSWEKMQAETASVKAFIRYGCEAFGVPYKVMMSPDKTRRVAEVRKILICMVKDRWDLSAPLIGRYFKRDHTSILAALGRKGKGEGRKVTPEMVREIRRRRANHEYLHTIAADYGISQSTVSKIVYRKKWRSVE